MIVLGLTGSIGMGKSTTAGMFRDAGVPVHDSDEAVHRLYASEAASKVEAFFPGVVEGGVVDRHRLANRVVDDPLALERLESIIHPLVRADSDEFLKRHRAAGSPMVVLDIPLLFETSARDRVDKVLVVTAPAEAQRRRVLSRPGMTRDKFEALLARQVADSEKRAQADFVVDTSQGLERARQEVNRIIREMTGDKPSETPL